MIRGSLMGPNTGVYFDFECWVKPKFPRIRWEFLSRFFRYHPTLAERLYVDFDMDDYFRFVHNNARLSSFILYTTDANLFWVYGGLAGACGSKLLYIEGSSELHMIRNDTIVVTPKRRYQGYFNAVYYDGPTTMVPYG